MREQRAKLSRNNDTTKAINYRLSRQDAFTRFLDDDGRLCMSDNAANLSYGPSRWEEETGPSQALDTLLSRIDAEKRPMKRPTKRPTCKRAGDLGYWFCYKNSPESLEWERFGLSIFLRIMQKALQLIEPFAL